jgi:tetratricopeptide (TPR) repeat protein
LGYAYRVGTFRFKAFISYSHHDRDWSAWLQRALESYRIPRRLIGSESEFGPVPRRLTPVFRDREDLPSASDLSIKVKEALEASEALIVVCSPTSAGSKWVNEEIRHFRSLGREDRIFALIVAGDPQADDPAQQCFPDALTTWLDGSPHEPLAADARKWADGKLLAKLKIVSGILGIRLDDLRQRNMQRRRRNWLLATTSAVAVLLITGSLVFTTLTSQTAVRLQRTNTEELLSYMLGNLKRLDPILGLEAIDQEDERIQEFLQTLGFDGMENDRLVDKGMEWREEGMAGHERGKLDEAMETFERSRAAFVELHQREGGTRRALFELGQAEFYVGYVHYDKGELDEAQEHFTRYGAITRRLVNEDPNDAEMVMELSYTLTNLSGVESARTDSDTDKALRLMQSALQYNQIALVLDPGNDVYRKALNNKLAFLADAWLDSCDLGKAFDFRQQAVVMARGLYQGSPDSDDLGRDLAYSLSGLALVQSRIPMPDQALANLGEARDLLTWLAAQGDENPRRHWEALMRQVRMLRIHSWAGPPGGLWPEMEAQRHELETLLLMDDFEGSVDFASFLIDYSRLASRLGKPVEADQALGEAMDRLSGLVSENPEHRISLQLLANAWFEHWNRHGALPSDQAAAMLEDYLVDPERATSCDDASLAARLELMRGNISLAKDYTLYLLGKGFYEPGFVAFCKRNELCEM